MKIDTYNMGSCGIALKSTLFINAVSPVHIYAGHLSSMQGARCNLLEKLEALKKEVDLAISEVNKGDFKNDV